METVSKEYSGYQYDSETGLYYLNARYYDSKIARFLSEDSYGGNANDPLSLNLYSYCNNEPIMYTDPTGHYMVGIYNDKGEWVGQYETDIIVDENHPYFDTGTPNTGIQVVGSATVNNCGNTAAIAVSTDESVTINNSGYVENVYTSKDSNVTVNNNGMIANSVNTGENSKSTINNTGFIDNIHFGGKSTNIINNVGFINEVTNNWNAKTEIDNVGYLGSALRGYGLFASLDINGRNIYQTSANPDFVELFNQRMGENSEKWAKGIENWIMEMLDGSDKTTNIKSYNKYKEKYDNLIDLVDKYKRANEKEKYEMRVNLAADGLWWSIKELMYTVGTRGLANHIDSSFETTSMRDTLLETASNKKLVNAINEMYRRGAKVGDGGLADAIRYELQTGELVGGKSHVQKGEDYLRNLKKIQSKEALDPVDQIITKDLIGDLEDALKGVK